MDGGKRIGISLGNIVGLPIVHTKSKTTSLFWDEDKGEEERSIISCVNVSLMSTFWMISVAGDKRYGFCLIGISCVKTFCARGAWCVPALKYIHQHYSAAVPTALTPLAVPAELFSQPVKGDRQNDYQGLVVTEQRQRRLPHLNPNHVTL